jgi:hypothetical protein
MAKSTGQKKSSKAGASKRGGGPELSKGAKRGGGPELSKGAKKKPGA